METCKAYMRESVSKYTCHVAAKQQTKASTKQLLEMAVFALILYVGAVAIREDLTLSLIDGTEPGLGHGHGANTTTAAAAVYTFRELVDMFKRQNHPPLLF